MRNYPRTFGAFSDLETHLVVVITENQGDVPVVTEIEQCELTPELAVETLDFNQIPIGEDFRCLIERQEIARQLEEINGLIQQLNNENPAESRLIVCSECRELFTEDGLWDHNWVDCQPQDDEEGCVTSPIRALAEYLTQDDPTDFPILERLLQKHADESQVDDFEHEPDRARICANEKWRSRS